MRNWRRVLVIVVIMGVGFIGAATTSAQDGNQFCVRAFMDLNGNGQRDDAGDVLLTHGISANLHLQNADGIIMDSGLLDTSPWQAEGLICFPNLSPGQYTITVTSAEYLPTKLDNRTTRINEERQSTVYFDFGAQPIQTSVASAPATETSSGDNEDSTTQLLVSVVGGLFTMFVVGFIGIIIYALVLRNNPTPTRANPSGAALPPEYYMRPDSQQPGIAPPHPDPDYRAE